MKTATLIKRTFSFLLICVVVFVIKWAYENYSTNEVVRDVVSIVLLFISMGIIIPLIGCVVIFFLDLSDGDYDQWFATHTDPIIKKVQDFFNRRNKVLSIIGVIIIFNSCTYNKTYFINLSDKDRVFNESYSPQFQENNWERNDWIEYPIFEGTDTFFIDQNPFHRLGIDTIYDLQFLDTNLYMKPENSKYPSKQLENSK